MGHGLDLAKVGLKGSLDQSFTITGDGGICDHRILRKLGIQLVQHVPHGFHRVALVASVEGIQQILLIIDQCGFGGGGSCVDAQEHITSGTANILAADLGLVVTVQERLVFLLALEQRLDVLGFRHLCLIRSLHPFHYGAQGDFILRSCQSGCADGNEVLGIFREYDLIILQLQRLDETGPKLRKEGQRSAQEGYLALDDMSACQSADGLIHHSLEDGSSQIRNGGAVVDQGLNVRLGEYAAACSDGIDYFIFFGGFIEPAGVGIQKDRHLVDEGSGTAGTGSVHALLDGGAIECDLGVFSSQLDCHISFRDQFFYCLTAGDDLLLKTDPQELGQRQASGTCDHRGQSDIPLLLVHLVQQFFNLIEDVGHMTFITGINHVILFIEQNKFYCCRSNINS